VIYRWWLFDQARNGHVCGLVGECSLTLKYQSHGRIALVLAIKCQAILGPLGWGTLGGVRL
jgi:hypothetical protein